MYDAAKDNNGDSGLPAVSVLIAVFNGERFLREALESIAAQTFRDFEVIVLDDGSTDGSLAIAQDQARKDERFRVVAGENQGLFVRLNAGLKMCRGELVAVMDSDDVSLPNRLECQHRFMEAHPEVLLVGGQVMRIDEDGEELGLLWRPLDHETIDRESMQGRLAITHPGMMYRRAAVEGIGGYSLSHRYGQDLDLALRLAEIGRVANVPEVVLRYRLHYGSVTMRRSEAQFESMVSAVALAHGRRGLSAPPMKQRKRWRTRTQADIHCSCALVARKGGFYRASWKHAQRALQLAPYNWRCWRAAVKVGGTFMARKVLGGKQEQPARQGT